MLSKSKADKSPEQKRIEHEIAMKHHDELTTKKDKKKAKTSKSVKKFKKGDKVATAD